MKFKFLLFFVLVSNFCFSQSFAENDTIRAAVIVTGGYGFSYRVVKVPKGLSSAETDYLKDLKTGTNFDIGVYYKFNSLYGGLGLKFNKYNSKGSGYSSEYGSFGDDINITFFGASVFLSSNSVDDGKKRVGQVFMEFALGYIKYRNDSYAFANEHTIYLGGNIGFSASGAYHFRITERFLIGPQLAYVGGFLERINVSYPDSTRETIVMDEESRERLHRIDLNVSAKFRF
ncbi:hypothetical protein FEDK69T_25880 [Flavobacterium enshiense DK69]|uniref:Outer membrane protein beta-barrel domain-containing protein n=1 Tax=Flavobacterium enshiense DK69 TaxID=1107311 RepID=V6S3J3_9FLAO|nr:hypothetical protein [Flavobacterium enshiense]ESU21221.1 hypothetical protein FEDK69T_25880 [Flavobacterium enshiense DK69]KGO93505.1 hypothetical protein Q767_14800 [Flavobacterium enshiense DK69]